MPIGKAMAETARIYSFRKQGTIPFREQIRLALRRWSLREHNTNAAVMLRNARSDKTPAHAISPSVTLSAPLQWLNRVGEPAHTAYRRKVTNIT